MTQDWQPLPTEDGSYTFFSTTFNEAFHSRKGAKTEAFQKFAEATHLAQRVNSGVLKLLDVCYGLGYNTAAALEVIWASNPACQVEVYGLELDGSVPQAAITPDFLQYWTTPVQRALVAIAEAGTYQAPQLTATLLLGDARQTIQILIKERFQADAIFFDPFSPRHCPQLWTVEFFHCIAQCLSPDGYLSTYCRAASVRTALKSVGLCLGTIPVPVQSAPHEWAQGTIAAWTIENLQPLSPMEQEHLQTRASIPYRDPELTNTAETILEQHNQEQASSTLESTSSWRRRWNIQ
jgi:tRNA U34 5-methylaminomethyl-2-thiouridine-forming methyltransferase MnmC